MRLIATVYILLTLFVAGIDAASADDKVEAKKYFNEGIRLQKTGDDAGATAAFEYSVKQFSKKSNLYNLANSYRAVNRPLDALSTFERIQNEFADKLTKDMREDIKAQIVEINASLVKLSITTEPEGAKIILNKENKGVTPMKEPVRLVAGTHTVEISMDGYETVTQNILLKAGTYKVASFTLKEKKSELSLTVSAPNATVFVDGMEMGKTPLPAALALDKGDHVVRITKDGFNPAEQQITLALAEARFVTIDLKPLSALPDPASVVAPSSARRPASSQALIAADTPKKRSPLLVVGIAGTLIMGGVTAGMWSVMGAKADDYEHNNKSLKNNWTDSLANTVKSDRDAALAFNKAAVVTTVLASAFVAVLSAGAGIKHHRNKSEQPSKVSLNLTATGAEVRF